MGILEEQLKGKSLADYTNEQLRISLNTALYTNTADMWRRYLEQEGYSGSVSDMMAKWWAVNNVPPQFRNYINSGLYLFNPRQLFLDGSVGVIFDNADLSTFYLDAAGTTPATVNGLVGLQLDKSQGLVLGPEVLNNSAFDSDTAWTKGVGWVISDGRAKAAGSNAGSSFLIQTGGLAGLDVNSLYQITIIVPSFTAGAIQSTGTTFANFGITSAGTYKFLMYPELASGSFSIQATAAGTICEIDSVSIKKLHGNHRYQATTGFKPVLRGTPTGSELFAAYSTPGAGWSVAGATGTATTASSALPTTTASVVGKFYRVTYTVTRSAGSVQLSFGGRTGVSRSAAGQYVEYFDNALNTNALTATGTSFTGTVRIDEVKDVSAGSVTAPYGLQYDGVDDFMQTASVNFSATDKMFVCAGVRKLSDAATGCLLELSANKNANPGIFAMFAPITGGEGSYVWYSKGTIEWSAGAFISAPDTSIITGIGDISGDLCRIRRNGSDVQTTALDQGTGNYGNYAIYFGRRGGTSLPFNGLDYGGICIGKTLTATQLAQAERWVAQRTGVVL